MNTTNYKNVNQLQSFIDTHLIDVSNEDSIHELIEQQLDTLMILMAMPEKEAQPHVLEFTKEYIASCPLFLEAYHTLAEATDIGDYTRAFLHTATAFFFDEHPVLSNLSGRHNLFCRAYLFHRMLEELNDRVALERDLPLSPADMSYTNLIAHTLISDNEANLLDQTVLIQLEIINVKQLDIGSDIFEQDSAKERTNKLKESGWGEVIEHWPFLTKDMADCFYDD